MLRLSELHVHGRKNRENVGLDDGYNKLDGVNHNENGKPGDARDTHEVTGGKKQAEEAAREKSEGRQADVASEHVGEKSNGKRDEAQKRGERLDDADQNVEREGDAGRSKGLDVAQGTHVLDGDDDEVHEGDKGQGEGDTDGARTRLAAGDDTDDVIEQDEEEQRQQEGAVLVGRLAQVAPEDVVADILDDILDAVDKTAARDERQTPANRKQNSKHDDNGDTHPEDVLGQARLTTTKHETWEEVMNNLVDFLTKVRE